MQYKLYNPFICCCIIAPAMVSESGCQSISIPAPEEDTSTSSVTYLRSTMTQERLSNLALLYIERDVSSQLWNSLDSLVLQFAEKHKNSRLVLC